MSDPIYDEGLARQQEKMASTRDMVSQRKSMLELMDLRAGESVLDVGSGNGIFAREMAELVGPSGNVCGIDNAPAMLNMARVMCPSGTFLEGDATQLPSEDLKYDVVTASQLLCFVDVDRALGEFWRVLKHGGRVVILDTDWGSLVWNSRDEALMNRAIRLYTSSYADAFVPRTLSRRLVSAGFEITGRHTLTVLNWDPDSESYAQQSAGFLESFMEASSEFTEQDWKAWSDDQKLLADTGEYMFSLNRYIFVAVKP